MPCTLCGSDHHDRTHCPMAGALVDPAGKVTDLARYRRSRALQTSDLCRWSGAFEHVAITHIRIAYAWQRMWIRFFMGV